MTVAAWIDERVERVAFAHAQANGLTADVFRSWQFVDTGLVQVALERLERGPHPSVMGWSLWIPESHPAPAKTRRNHELAQPPSHPEPSDPLAACIAMLDWAGREIEDRERRVWRREWPADASADADAGVVWTALVEGRPWAVRELCESLWLKSASQAFAAVLAARDLPREVQRRVLTDLEEAFFYRLLGVEDGPAGWTEIAIRLLETASPVEGPAAVLSGRGRDLAGRCLANRAGWGRTLARLWPDQPDRSARALTARDFLEHLSGYEQLLDLHTALRLIDTCPASPAEAWRVVGQNRGKARGRLRALVARETAWLPALLALDALAERSRVAVTRFAWSWAWQELALDFAFDASRPTTPPCEDLPAGMQPLSQTERTPLVSWVLLVVLKGRTSHLIRWVSTGGTGDRDSTWARLLKDLPPPLHESAAYPRVRHALREALPHQFAELTPLVEDVAALSVDRRLKARVTALLQPGWDGAVPFPRSGFPTFVAHAADFLQRHPEDPTCL
jgi:hypothetical protein